MSIAPIKRSVEVKGAPAQAFELFATRMGEWWPKGKTVGKKPHAAIVLDPIPGGRWIERDQDGRETQWGKDFTFDPDLVTEVELTFAPVENGTLVTLEHRHLERFGAAAERVAGALSGGWSPRLDQFAAFANTHA